MNGVHDLGGMQGFGPVEAEPEATEPVFHAEWEKAVSGMVSALGFRRFWSLDRFRRMIETQRPVDYLQHSYYENWFAALERLIADFGLLDESACATEEWKPVFASSAVPRYQAGDHVRAANRHPTAHTRSPRYARGRRGVIVRHCGAEPLPELAAENICAPQHVYCVRFEAAELWGTATRDAVYLELWEEYLEPLS
jgi:nitrile hydratase